MQESQMFYEKRLAYFDDLENRIDELVRIVSDQAQSGAKEGSSERRAAEQSLATKVEEAQATIRKMAYVVPEESREVLGQCGQLCERFQMIAFLGSWVTDGDLWDDIMT